MPNATCSDTTFETFLIQRDVLHKATGATPVKLPSRSPWYPYPIFESQLPIAFCLENSAIILDPETLTQTGSMRYLGKPQLQCPFCTRFKAYHSIIELWSHFVNQHSDSSKLSNFSIILVEKEHLVKEFRRTATLWLDYWTQYSDGGKRRDNGKIEASHRGRLQLGYCLELGTSLIGNAG